ncbi:hypothetical protein OY671_008362, partial [Metschnikowia pulcherrima]
MLSAYGSAVSVTLDQIPLGTPARIDSVDWDLLVPEEAERSRASGSDAGAHVRLAYRGVFVSRDPSAVDIGRMTVASRRVHARAMHVESIGATASAAAPSASFNASTGARQKIANYPGVTVERKSGAFVTPAGRRVAVVDSPGTYSSRGRSPDEEITRDVVLGMREDAVPDCIVCVADATNSRLGIRSVSELKRVGRPMSSVLNMFDSARHRGITIDT